MKTALIYVSPNGTTRRLTEILKQIFLNDNQSVEAFDLGRSPYREDPKAIIDRLHEFDLIGLGSPVYHMDTLIPMQKFLKALTEQAYDRRLRAFIYLTYSGITSGKTFLNSTKALEKAKIGIIGGIKVQAPHFHHLKERFDTERITRLSETFYDKLKRNHFAEIPEKQVRKLFSPEKKRVHWLYPIVHIVGKMRELPITIEANECRKCGKCVSECPSGAIHLADFAQIDPVRCLHCYHCTIACPFDAIRSPIEKIDQMIIINRRVVGTEHPADKCYLPEMKP
ncbi:MAG TPA: 4Fe-4S binding protein [Thermotogota bacterium]|nr:4Fe-4S binding protein [Thermotogota bacterium]HPJ87755.1 4Fe-4S binding protein [Thermotogota bacterium]HPR95247.1 4Fe-4S binding protein [Thermotogota bacterium]